MSNSSITIDCVNAELLSRSIIYKVIILVKGSANIASIALLVIHAFLKTERKIFHPNTRTIYGFILVLFLLMAFHNGLVYIYEFYRLSIDVTNTSSCQRLWPTPVIFYLRTVYIGVLNGINASLIVLCIERAVCICRISNYEESRQPIVVSFFLAILTIIFTIVFVFLCLPGQRWSTGMAISTTRNSVNSTNYQVLLMYLLCMEFVSFFFFLFIHNWSSKLKKRLRGFENSFAKLIKYDNSSSNQLSVKFQIEETLRTTRLLLPVIMVKVCMQVFSLASAFVTNFIWINPPTDVQMTIYEIDNLAFIQSFTSAILLLAGSGQIKKIFCCTHARVNNDVVPVKNLHEQEDHFNQLKSIFEKR